MTQVVTALEPVSNNGKQAIEFSTPYTATIKAKSTAPILFHRWSCEEVEAKSAAAKGSKAKKTDNLEAYVYRDEKQNLCIPSEYFRMALIQAAKFRQDPRSPRKSAMDLFKAGIACADELCSLGVKDWHYEDRRRVQVQRNGVTRVRPALREWSCTVRLLCLLPEYVSPELLNEVFQAAGRLIGVGDFRPTFGRFQVVGFQATC